MTPEEESAVNALKASVARLEKELLDAKAKAAEPAPRTQAGATARQVEALQEELAEVKKELKAAKAPAAPGPVGAVAAPATVPPVYRGVLKERK